MRRFHTLLAAAALLAAATGARAAGLAIDIKMAHSQLIRFEPVVAFLSIRNDTAEPFLLTDDADADLRFVVEQRRDDPVRALNDARLVRHLRIMPGETRDVMVDLSAAYDLSALGGYFLNAEIVWNGSVYTSRRVRIEIAPGVQVAQAVKGIPAANGETRRYILRYLAREHSEFLFMCVEDEAGATSLGVFDLGRLLRVAKPTLEVGQDGIVVVMHQSAPSAFTRSILRSAPEGVSFVDQSYVREDGRPVEEAEALTPGSLTGSGPSVPMRPVVTPGSKEGPAPAAPGKRK